ncbi:MAG: DUF177 domain-containing protein [Clostridia bacterium]|nr:DUF177 domain-containing protein [Clostridia bacterium]
MKLDVTQVLNGRLDRMPFSYRFSPDTADVSDDSVILPEDLTIPEDGILVEGEIYSVGGYLRLTAHVTADYVTPCARCLDPIEETMEFDLERTVRSGNAVEVSEYDDDEEWDGVLEDVLYLTDSHVCPDGDILEQILLEIPMVSLCSDDCEGLCPHCGHKIADGCDCAAREAAKKTIDPRMAKLQVLLDQYKADAETDAEKSSENSAE